MKFKNKIKLPLTDFEKENLRKHKLKVSNIFDYAVDELEILLDITNERAKELCALAEFQTIPSIGIRFAEDLVFLGYYSLSELKGKDAAQLTDEYELRKNYWIDSCVEDQFRLVVYYANSFDNTKKWWDFTEERKKYRMEKAYPPNRPKTAWYETMAYQSPNKKDRKLNKI